MLGDKVNKRKIYLNIKEGKIVGKNENGEQVFFSFVEGILEKISQKEREFRGEKVLYWYIDLRDPDNEELYSLGFPFSSNIFKSIILSLASASKEELKLVRISPYYAQGYDKVIIYAGGKKMNWITKDLPPVEEIELGGKIIKNDYKRMAYITELVDKISKLTY